MVCLTSRLRLRRRWTRGSAEKCGQVCQSLVDSGLMGRVGISKYLFDEIFPSCWNSVLTFVWRGLVVPSAVFCIPCISDRLESLTKRGLTVPLTPSIVPSVPAFDISFSLLFSNSIYGRVRLWRRMRKDARTGWTGLCRYTVGDR